VVVGYDFRFGHKRAGDVAALQRLGEEYAFGVSVIEPVTWKDQVCSSSRIREAVQRGDVALAADLLGHPFLLEGRVVHGDRRGHDLGYPTANLRPHGRRPVLPPAGVYAVRAGINGGDGIIWRDAVASLGVRPTFAGHDFMIEIHLFDVDLDLYGQRLWCCFIERLRDEKAFPSAEALTAQMDRDSARARVVLADTPTIPIQ
jgi:riboflavin kinase/FMN adenylyltransferase